ncbi:MAG: hypothetical protein G01um101470_106 [Parcubacteria group bacterium Gr01-1014_70]|nr:MAG: hypothetical protein G01um101470_106 [Parcubacteria group bacterium Gr01-1014_70]
MPRWLQNIIVYLQALNIPPNRKDDCNKVIYERIPGTDREILARTIRADGTETKTIVVVMPPNFKP